MTKIKYFGTLYTVISLLVIIAMISGSCKSITDDSITGTWVLVPLDNSSETFDITWTFDGGNSLDIATYNKQTLLTSHEYFTYEVKVESLKRRVYLTGTALSIGGKYSITKANSKFLVLVYDEDGYGTYQHAQKEFTKQ